MVESLDTQGPRILEIEVEQGASVSVSPERGGIITALSLGGRNLLYLDETTFHAVEKSVRGGVPILFPNFGPLNDPAYPGMPQHGIARISNQWKLESQAKGDGFVERLVAHERDARYPYLFELEQRARLEEGRWIIEMSVRNIDDKELPISFGLHPYFYVPHALREQILFDFPGGEVIAQELPVWSADKATAYAPNHGPLRVTIPSVGTLVIEASPEYHVFAFWAQPEKDFICIEPAMHRDGGLSDSPVYVAPGETFTARLSIGFEPA